MIDRTILVTALAVVAAIWLWRLIGALVMAFASAPAARAEVRIGKYPL